MSNTATTTLSADDVRWLVMTARCTTCNGPHTGHCGNDHHPAVQSLFTRCRGCQPEGLEWRGSDPIHPEWWLGWCIPEDAMPCARSHAIDLILMSIARDGKKAFIAPPQAIQQKYYDCLVDAVVATDLPGAVAARHRLKDLEDKP